MNVDWLSNLPAPVRRRLYFGLQRLLGSRLASAWREIQEWESLESDLLEERVDARLGSTLESATRSCAYYRQLGLVRSPRETAREYLGRFPPLDRSTIRSSFRELVADPLRGEIASPQSRARKAYDWIVVRTGGTTGVPTSVVHDALGRDWGRATRMLAAKWCGLPLGTPYFRLWGSEPELLQAQSDFQLRVLFALLGAVPLNAFRAREQELRQHYETIRRRPEIRSLMAYVDAAVSLGLFLKEKNLEPPRLKTIMSCAGTLTPAWRGILTETFQAEVFDKYGSRECCDLACECREHSGLHVFVPNAVVEIVDERGEPCHPGQVGHLLITLLNNPGFPLIRYRIGDLGAWAPPGRCPCGVAWPRLERLEGRADDMLVTEDGTLLSSVFVRHVVGVSLNFDLIREWQVEQVGPTRFILRYIPRIEEGLEANLEAIADRFRRALGQSTSMEFQRVQEIPVSASGKVRWVLNTWRLSQIPGTDPA